MGEIKKGKKDSSVYRVPILLDATIPREKIIIDLIQRYPGHSRSKSALLRESLLLGIGPAMQLYPPPEERTGSVAEKVRVTPKTPHEPTQHPIDTPPDPLTPAARAARTADRPVNTTESHTDTRTIQPAVQNRPTRRELVDDVQHPVESEWAPLAHQVLDGVKETDGKLTSDPLPVNPVVHAEHTDNDSDDDNGDTGAGGHSDFGYFANLLDT